MKTFLFVSYILRLMRRRAGLVAAVLCLHSAGVPNSASGQTTPVLFPLNSLFGGAAYNKPLTITAANTMISDGQNLWAGTYTVVPASTTNPVVGLYPNTYLLAVPGVARPVRFIVPASTNVLDVAALITGGTLFYFGTNGWANLVAGTNLVFVTNRDGSLTLNDAVGAAVTDATNAVGNALRTATNSFQPTNLNLSAWALLAPAAYGAALTNSFDATNAAFNALRTATNSFQPTNAVLAALQAGNGDVLTNAHQVNFNLGIQFFQNAIIQAFPPGGMPMLYSPPGQMADWKFPIEPFARAGLTNLIMTFRILVTNGATAYSASFTFGFPTNGPYGIYRVFSGTPVNRPVTATGTNQFDFSVTNQIPFSILTNACGDAYMSFVNASTGTNSAIAAIKIYNQ